MSVDLRENNTRKPRQYLLNRSLNKLKNLLIVPYTTYNNYYEIPLANISVNN